MKSLVSGVMLLISSNAFAFLEEGHTYRCNNGASFLIEGTEWATYYPRNPNGDADPIEAYLIKEGARTYRFQRAEGTSFARIDKLAGRSIALRFRGGFTIVCE